MKNCLECGGRVIYAPDSSIIAPIDPNDKTGKNEPFGCGDVVCSHCGLVVGRWQTSEHATKVSHKTFIRNWKPKCRFCHRRTVKLLDRKGCNIYICQVCYRGLTSILSEVDTDG